MTESQKCAALFIAAPSSGVGKTSLTAGLARHHRNQGKTVRVFKIGPDYLDPKILELASGQPVYQLDLWMVGEQACRDLLYQAARTADLILIEGAMGLFDGNPSGADLAQLFGIPVIAVIDARAMAQTFAAIAHGLATFRPELDFKGVVATQPRSDYHTTVIQAQLPDYTPMLAILRQDERLQLPVRHLGLVQPQEQGDLDRRLDRLAEVLCASPLLDLLPECRFQPGATDKSPVASRLDGVRIGIAKDEAFSFIYPANIDCLLELGAELVFFSPLHDAAVPAVDSLWFPGGYPELYADMLSANKGMMQSIQHHFIGGKKVYAECGGMLYLVERLQDLEDQVFDMVGLMPGKAAMTERSGCQGMQATVLPEGELRGHAHHRSTLNTSLQAIAHGKRTRSEAPGEAIYRLNGLTASYLHSYFPSNRELVSHLFAARQANE